MPQPMNRLGDLVSQGDLIGDIRETIRKNLTLYATAKPSAAAITGEMIAELAELLARHVTQAIVFTPVPLDSVGISACGDYAYQIEHDFLGATWGVHVTRVDRRSQVERGLGLPAPIAALAAELEQRQDQAIGWPDPRAHRCSVCDTPTHPSDSDDENRCAACVRAAGETPLLPNEKD